MNWPASTSTWCRLRGNDGIYGREVVRCLEALGVEDVKTTPGSPWQNAYVECVIGSIRRELLDHVIVSNERHLNAVRSACIIAAAA